MNKWGILQYFDTLSEGENGQTKADLMGKRQGVTLSVQM